MSFYDDVPLENLVVLVTRGERYGQIAKVLCVEKNNGKTRREVEYVDGQREILSEGYDLYVRYCNGPVETDECVASKRDLVSLCGAFKELNKTNDKGNYEFCVAYGALFFKFQNKSEHERK